MKFNDLEINTKFQFYFDKNYSWEYEKLNQNYIVCIKCPNIHDCVGKVYPIGRCFTSEVILLTEKVEN